MGLEKKLRGICGDRLRMREPLARYTTFGIGGPADYFVDASHEKELEGILRLASQEDVPWFILGFGSNVLISDRGVRGIVLRLGGDFKKLKEEKDRIHAGAAARLQRLVSFAAKAGFGGAESLIGIPGTLGGALIMNAGTREGTISDHLQEVRVFQVSGFRFQTLKKQEVKFGYRWSSLQEYSSVTPPPLLCESASGAFRKQSFRHSPKANGFKSGGGVIVSAKFKFPIAQSKEVVLKRMGELMRRRKETQPVEMKNAGSIFKNPQGNYAARLIEGAGLKGLKMGDAMVSPKHANFIVNLGRAKACDVLALMEEIEKTVFKKFTTRLEPEIHLIGDFSA